MDSSRFIAQKKRNFNDNRLFNGNMVLHDQNDFSPISLIMGRKTANGLIEKTHLRFY